jgi:hypothetical protein
MRRGLLLEPPRILTSQISEVAAVLSEDKVYRIALPAAVNEVDRMPQPT